MTRHESVRPRQAHSLLSSRTPIVLVLLALFCLGLGLGTQILLKTSPTPFAAATSAQLATEVVDPENRLGACTIKDQQVHLILSPNQTSPVQIQIKHFGVDGETVYRRTISQTSEKIELTLDVSFLPTGLFMFKAESGSKKIVRLIRQD